MEAVALMMIGAGFLIAAVIVSALDHAEPPPEPAPNPRRRRSPDDNPATARAAAADRITLVREADTRAIEAVADIFATGTHPAIVRDIRDRLQERARQAAQGDDAA